MDLAQSIFVVILLYLACGIFFAPFFIFFLAPKRDGGLSDTSFATKLLFIPGAAVLWPYLIWRELFSK